MLKLKVLFLYQERQNASAKKDNFLSDCFVKSLFFLKLLDGCCDFDNLQIEANLKSL